WIDAHSDLHSPYTTPSGNIHGMPLASALGIDNLSNSTNDLEGDDTMNYWEILKNIGGINPKIYPEDLVFIAVRDMEAPEIDFIKRNNIKVVTVRDVRNAKKIKDITDDILKNYLSKCDVLYVSFDIDSLDKSLVPGTGTPVKNGLYVEEAKKILEDLLKDPRLACFEITEINPLLDAYNETALRVFPIFRNSVNTILKARKKAQTKKSEPVMEKK